MSSIAAIDGKKPVSIVLIQTLDLCRCYLFYITIFNAEHLALNDRACTRQEDSVGFNPSITLQKNYGIDPRAQQLYNLTGSWDFGPALHDNETNQRQCAVQVSSVPVQQSLEGILLKTFLALLLKSNEVSC